MKTDTDQREAIQDAVLSWWELRKRDLPWRNTRDPWLVLVSETMLQQTQVSRVLPLYEKFVARFPSARDCASAPSGDVVRLWEGLGYNRRALNLHACAVAVTQAHEGVFPQDIEALRALPGVGPYTSAAIAVFAFEHDAAVLDTNVARILARTRNETIAKRAVAQAAAEHIVPHGDAWRWNQALLDLGATICTARSPKCESCPIEQLCAWRQANNLDPDPAIGSAGVSGKQSKFVGSDRQGRGRLIAALRRSSVRATDLATTMGWPGDNDRAERVLLTLERDGLVVRRRSAMGDEQLILP